MPEISVIMPLYNTIPYLREAIESVLGQTFQDFELLIVDDASTDDSYELCQKLYRGNAKVRLFRHEQNKTAGGARNTGLDEARGKYIAFLDSDDLYIPEALAVMHSLAEDYKAEVVHSPGCLIPQGDQEHVKIADEFRTIIFDDMPASDQPVLLPEDKSYKLSDKGRVDIVKGNFYEYYEEADGTSRKVENQDRNMIPDSEKPFTLEQDAQISWGHPSIWSAIYRREFLEENHITFMDAWKNIWK